MGLQFQGRLSSWKRNNPNSKRFYRWNNGTLFHSPTAVAGEIDGAAHFVSASTQTITWANPSDFPITTAWTAEAWVNPVAPGAMTVVGWGQTVNNGVRIGANGTGGTWRLNFYGRSGIDGGTVQRGSWQHVVGTFDGSSLRLLQEWFPGSRANVRFACYLS